MHRSEGIRKIVQGMGTDTSSLFQQSHRMHGISSTLVGSPQAPRWLGKSIGLVMGRKSKQKTGWALKEGRGLDMLGYVRATVGWE